MTDDRDFGDLTVYRNADGTVRVEGDAPKILIHPALLANIDLEAVTVTVEFAPGYLYRLVARRNDGTIEAERMPTFGVPRELSDEEVAELRAEFDRVTAEGNSSRIVVTGGWSTCDHDQFERPLRYIRQRYKAGGGAS